MPSLCRRAERNIRRRIQRFLSILPNFPRSALRGGRYFSFVSFKLVLAGFHTLGLLTFRVAIATYYRTTEQVCVHCIEEFNRSYSLQTMSGKEKSKFDEMAKADKVRYDREMKDYGPAKGGKKKKDPNAPKRPP